jgi:hypothetical protein
MTDFGFYFQGSLLTTVDADDETEAWDIFKKMGVKNKSKQIEIMVM